MSHHSALLAAGLLGLGARVPTLRPSEPSCDVEVSSRSAQITFPAVRNGDWTWNRTPLEPAHPLPNYRWTLFLYPGPGLHFEISRAAHGPIARGSLAAMLKTGEAVVTWPSSDPRSEFDTWKRVTGVRAEAKGDRVILNVEDSALVHDLFYLNHPTESRCDFSPGFPPDEAYSVWGKVHYVRR